MQQTRLGSLIEVVFNTAIGFAVNYAANLTVLPRFGLHPTPGQAFWMGIVFTVISVARSWVVRRVLNRAGVHERSERLAEILRSTFK